MATGITKSIDAGGDTTGTTQIVHETGVEGANQGDTIPFTSNIPLGDLGIGESDRISFELQEIEGTWTAINLTLISKGILINSTTSEDITIGPTGTVLIKDNANLTGNITLDGGMLSVFEGASISGIITGPVEFAAIEGNANLHNGFSASGAGSQSYVKLDNVSVTGDVSTTSVKTTVVDNCNVTGSVSSSDDTNVSIINNTIENNLTIVNATFCKQENNTVGGFNSGCPGDDG